LVICITEFRAKASQISFNMHSMWHDVRYAVRIFRRNPGYVLVVVLTLSLGVGVNTAFFSVANFMVLRPMPAKDPQQLVVLATREGSSEIRDVSYPDFLDYRKQGTELSDLMAYRLGFDSLAGENDAQQVITSYVTGNYFSTLGIRPVVGRLLEPSEGWTPGADPLLVLGYSYWQRRFGGDPGIIGKTVRLDGHPMTIVGVAERGFPGAYYFVETDVYAPIGNAAPASDSFWTARGERGEAGLFVVGRLKPGVSLKQARSSLRVVAERLALQYPEAEKGTSLEVYPETLARPQAAAANDLPVLVPLFLLLALLVLLVACINIANLSLARANDRLGEMATRVALGAGRLRLVGQLLTENLLLAITGGVAALFVGLWLARMLQSICVPIDFPMFRMNFVFDWRVFVYAFATTAAAGLAVGLFLAHKLWRADLNSMLHEGGRALSSSSRRSRQRSAFLVLQVAGSTLLLVIAGLFARMLDKAQRMELGFDPHHVLNLRLDVNQVGYDQAQGKKLYEEFLSRVTRLPGVTGATYAYSIPFGSGTLSASVQAEGQILQPGQSPPQVFYNIVGPSYFQTLSVPLLSGRAFASTDTKRAPRVAIISQQMAERFWGRQNAIGKRFRMGKDSGWLEVIGVCRDAIYVNPALGRVPYFYLPVAQNYTPQLALQIRTPLAPAAVAHEVERQLHELEPNLAVTDVLTMEQQLQGANGFFLLRVGADSAVGLGMLALILAVVGIYGIASYSTSQRTHEIGVRLALGALPRDIRNMVLRQGLLLVGIGAAAGIISALALARAVSGFLIGVSPDDPATFLGVTALLGTAALLACYLPARRATRLDPIAALRSE
jgi:predicted permease